MNSNRPEKKKIEKINVGCDVNLERVFVREEGGRVIQNNIRNELTTG